MVRSVFHPTDFSLESRVAFAHAHAIAILRRAKLSILHAGAEHLAEDEWRKFPPVRRTLERWGLLEPGSPRSAIFEKLAVEVSKVSWKSRNPVDAILEYVRDHEIDLMVARLTAWADSGDFDLILTCGGTGVSPRDVTPEATRRIVRTEIPGFGELMRATSLAKSPHAVVSRALAGIRARCLIINLPGSPRAALENLEAVWSAVPHTVAKLQGDDAECGSP